jgi:hypothetical protein
MKLDHTAGRSGARQITVIGSASGRSGYVLQGVELYLFCEMSIIPRFGASTKLGKTAAVPLLQGARFKSGRRNHRYRHSLMVAILTVSRRYGVGGANRRIGGNGAQIQRA